MNLRRIAKGAEKQLRIARVRTLAGVREFATLRSAFNLPRNETFSLRSSSADGVRVRLVDPEESFERRPPHMPCETEPYWLFQRERSGTVPASFVAELKGGRFWGFYGGSVFTGDGRLVPELSKDVWGDQLHSAFVRLRLPKARFLPGRTLSLVTPEAGGNYHHWTVDLLPRAGLAERAGYSLRDFDHVLIKDRGLPYQKEALERLGITGEKLVRISDDTCIETETLVVPSVRHDNTRVRATDVEFVRRLYLPQEPARSTARRRLYVGRRDASFRHILNEPEIMPLLRAHGFEEVSMSGMSVQEQAQLFSEAAGIVAPNGSALANLVFANRACRVIELFAPGWVVGYNWMLSDLIGLDYTALIGKGPRPPEGALPRELKQDIVVDPVALKTLLASFVVSARA